jgi:hypothetical protein
LVIDLTNSFPDPKADTQEIAGVSFTLVQGVTTLVSTGSSLSTTIGNGSGSGATLVTFPSGSSTTSTTPSVWQLAAGTGFNLTAVGHGPVSDLIIGPGPYDKANASITGHGPSLAGTVEFTILNVQGLTPTTQISNITLTTGTSAGGIVQSPNNLACTGTCNGTITNDTVATPEPATLLMAGGALLVVGSIRRRFFGRPTKPVHC